MSIYSHVDTPFFSQSRLVPDAPSQNQSRRKMLITSTVPSIAVLVYAYLASALIFPKMPAHGTSTITLDYGTFRGKNGDATTSYLGIPFGQAKRFEPATLFTTKLKGVQDATKYGQACPQIGISPIIKVLFLPGPLLNTSEDCFSINVQVPFGTSVNASLPVAFFVHGGGYKTGSGDVGGKGTGVEGINLVKKSIQMNQPIIYVSANHRLNIFGLLAGKEMTESGSANLLLCDQRLAMEWTQKYIAQFGGDPTKVTLMGQSAGSAAVSMHLLLNDGNPDGIFRGAMMFSGSPIRLSPQNRGQGQFDDVVRYVGCDQSHDRLACLKAVPFKKLQKYVNSIPDVDYNGLAFPFTPRQDGHYLTASPHDLVSQKKIANVPIVIGDCKDEGTFFALFSQGNTTTDDDFKRFFKNVFWPNATNGELDELLKMYPSDPAAGSPYDTGLNNALGPQYKRLASVQSDFWFESGRRHFLDNAPNSNKWTYQVDSNIPVLGNKVPFLQLLKLDKIPFLGSFHGIDLLCYMFGTIPETLSPSTKVIMTSIISFVNTLDPTASQAAALPLWPRYNSTTRQMYHITEDGPDVITDDYRSDPMKFLLKTESFQL